MRKDWQMAVFAAQGDAQRSLALLWRAEPDRRGVPGPKPALSVDAVVDAAIEVADRTGMAELSMRLVGERLGRTAMALYTYVPSKRELLDLMYDKAIAELPSSYDPAGGWRAAIGRWAADLRECYLRHPWLLEVSNARPVLGPGEFAMLNTLVAILRETGLGPAVLRAVLAALIDFVRGAARTVADARRAAAATGVSDVDWWAARSGQLLALAPDLDARFPMVSWINGDAVQVDESAPYLEQQVRANFEVGLGVLLDGLDAAVTAARAGQPG